MALFVFLPLHGTQIAQMIYIHQFEILTPTWWFYISNKMSADDLEMQRTKGSAAMVLISFLRPL